MGDGYRRHEGLREADDLAVPTTSWGLRKKREGENGKEQEDTVTQIETSQPEPTAEPAPRRPPGLVYWLIARIENGRVEVLTLDRAGDEMLPVFSHEEEAEMFLRFGGLSDDCWISESDAEELISVLYGYCAGVKEVALDPLPTMVDERTVGLVSLPRERFIESITARRYGMTEMKRVGDLEIAEDMDAQRRNWRFQRIGTAVMALVALAGLLGLFGGTGPLSRATAGNQQAPLSIEEYERFARFGKPTTLQVSLDAAASPDGKTHLWLSREYVQSVQIQEIDPLPERVEAAPDRFVYVFDTEADGPTAIAFELEPDEIGPLEGRIGLDGGSFLTFGQFVYP
jgi:hypothetical protein